MENKMTQAEERAVEKMVEQRDAQKCSLCDKKAEYFSSPFGNPDEPALCEEHYKDMRNRLLLVR